MTKQKEDLATVKKTIQILNGVSYATYSKEKTDTYLKYMEGKRADEKTLIEPILFPKFAEQILNFKLGKSLWPQTSVLITHGYPDFIPVDTRTHPFVFDVKGTDTEDLSKHYKDKKKYIKDNELRYLILTNIRDLDVYTEERAEEIEEYNFNFIQLYQDYKEDPKTILDKENTKRFLRFVERFSYKELTLKEKVEKIREARPWKRTEELDAELLTSRLKHIRNLLHEDVQGRKEEIEDFIESDPERARSVAQEIEVIVSDILPGHEIKEEITEETLRELLNSPEKSIYGRARDAFFNRVACFAMTRLLLVRVWEDIGFIDQSLYDGGFDKWYKNFNQEIRRVLRYAFGLAADRYKWLFDIENNYSWFEPDNSALIDALYELSHFYLGALNQDILGTIYEEYVDKIDKRNKGQYYTPREIVSFIWDRVGFKGSKAFFWHIEGKRVPKLVFDPATGSGGFLVEAARRIREELKINWNDFQDLFDLYRAILYGLFGSEISDFPYYITEVNLLIQLTPIIKRMMEFKKRFKETTSLGIVCVDSLSLYNLEPSLLPDETKEYKGDRLHRTLFLDRQKRAIYKKIKETLVNRFYYCCANPPYVGEKGRKELFRETLRNYPYWRKYYQGKMDYLYWFIILGLSKLRNPGIKVLGGRLGFITSAYWPTANGASELRKYILKNAKIKEMIFFENVKIFEHAKGQHSMVFVLTKCSGEEHREERKNNHIRIVQVKCKNQDLPGKTIKENLVFLTKHIQEHTDKPSYEDKFIKVFWSGVKQGELSQDGGPWNEIFIGESDKEFLRKIESCGAPLEKVLTPYQGIVPNPDRTTIQNVKFLASTSNVKPNEGVFVLNESEINQLGVTLKEKELIKPSYRNSDISPYFVDIPKDKKIFLIYICKNHKIEDYPNIKTHLERYREILQRRREVREGKIPWYSLHWPRKESLFRISRIVCSNWGNQWQPFALQKENFYERRDITFFVPKPNLKESIFYFLGILNSSLIRKWGKEKLKQKGYMRQKLQEQIPIHRINFDDSKEVRMHDEIVDKVKLIREKMTQLAQYSKYFKDQKLTRLRNSAPLPKVNDESTIKDLSSKNLYNLRIHPEIKIEMGHGFDDSRFCLNKVEEPELILTGKTQLKLISKDKSAVFITGPYELLKLFYNILPNWKSSSWAEIKENLLLPDTFSNFKTHKENILNKVQQIRSEISQLQKEIDQIIYKLYGITDEEQKIIEESLK